MREVGIKELKRGALLALVLGETTASAIREILIEHETVAASAIAEVEARAGLARARRGRRLTAGKEREAWTRFELIWSNSAILDDWRTGFRVP